MRVNIYAEEMTDRVEIVTKQADNTEFTGVRFYLELPVTKGSRQIRGPFIHKPGDDDSSAVTFWGKQDLRDVLQKALDTLDAHYAEQAAALRERLDRMQRSNDKARGDLGAHREERATE